MSDEENDLFGSSDDGSDEDTDDLLATTQKSIAKKKQSSAKKKPAAKRLQKAKNIPDADNDSDNDDALFDSDDDDDDDQKSKSKSRLSKKKTDPSSSTKKPAKALSKREKMEALQARRRAAAASEETTKSSSSSSKPQKDSTKKKGDKKKGDKGYDSGDSYDSETFVRTKDDDDFVVFDDDDPDAAKEYYAEQQFDDERPDESDFSEDEHGNRKRKGGVAKPRGGGKKRKAKGGLEGIRLKEGEVPDNPVLAAVYRMKKKKKTTKGFLELKEEGMAFLQEMERAANEDDKAIAERRPAMHKLKMLSQVVEKMTNKEMIKPLLDADVLVIVKRWIQPLPNGTLGNVTLRQKIVEAVHKMGTGEDGVQMNDLKRSDFGKVIMSLYMHKKETPQMKRLLKGLIEQYSREIFKKSGNMTELKDAQSFRREGGLAGIARAQAAERAMAGRYENESPDVKSQKEDFGSMITKKARSSTQSSKGRVSVPYSKGFQFTVRPSNKSGDVADKKNRAVKDGRKDFHRKIMDRSRPSAKGNQATAGLSIEGRPAK